MSAVTRSAHPWCTAERALPQGRRCLGLARPFLPERRERGKQAELPLDLGVGVLDDETVIGPARARTGESHVRGAGARCFAYPFENLTDCVAGLIEAIGLERYVLYVHDSRAW